MMILLGGLTILFTLQILSFTIQGLVFALVYGLVYGYFCIVIYSLNDILRQENERGQKIQYRSSLDGKA